MISALILAKLHEYGFVILKWLAIAGAVLAVLLRVRNSGRQIERVETLEKAHAEIKEKNEAVRMVRSANAAERKRLRAKWTR